MSGIWGGQTALDLYLQEQGINTLFFAGVNADQVRLDATSRPVRSCATTTDSDVPTVQYPRSVC